MHTVDVYELRVLRSVGVGWCSIFISYNIASVVPIYLLTVLCFEYETNNFSYLRVMGKLASSLY